MGIIVITGVLASRVSTSLGIRALTAVINTTSTRTPLNLYVGFEPFNVIKSFNPLSLLWKFGKNRVFLGKGGACYDSCKTYRLKEKRDKGLGRTD